MPVGDRALSLLEDESERALVKQFLAMVPRFLRSEVDELVVRLHPLPTLESILFTVFADLIDDPDSEGGRPT